MDGGSEGRHGTQACLVEVCPVQPTLSGTKSSAQIVGTQTNMFKTQTCLNQDPPLFACEAGLAAKQDPCKQTNILTQLLPSDMFVDNLRCRFLRLQSGEACSLWH